MGASLPSVCAHRRERARNEYDCRSPSRLQKGHDMSNGYLALLAAMWGGSPSYMRPRRDTLAGIDIEHEYTLIQRKASNLSASQRREVEHRYHRIHRKATT